MKEQLNQVMFSAQHSAIREFSNLAKATPGCVALTLGEPDFDTPQMVKDEVFEAFGQIKKLNSLEIVGVMNMAPLGIPEEEIGRLFSDIVQIKNELEKKYN